MTLHSILCPVDFSDPSRQALRWAAAIARRFGSRLTVMTALDPLLAEAARARLGIDLAKDETEPELRDFVAATAPRDGTAVLRPALDVRVGDPTEAIVGAAARERADLVVMGTHGLGGLRKIILGSTTARVLRSGRAPVLAVPPHAPAPNTGEHAASLGVAGVIAAVDFSDTAAAAVAWAADFARELAVPLTLLHVVEPIVAPPQWIAYASESEEPQRADALARLEHLLPEVPGREAVVAVGGAAETIAAVADERGAGVIVMGLTGEQGPFAPRPGSIAYRVLGLAKMPVVVVPTS